MKFIKQLTFNITQSRRIKNFAQKQKIKEKEILSKYQQVMHIIYKAWEKNYKDKEDISFRNYFLALMKYAEFAHRLKERYKEIQIITEHVEILREALVEYEQDYTEIARIERIVKTLGGGYQ
ncbi:MAG: hypothetical protein ACTSP3_15815 [Candidatus Heimdallarchaeaceae archaeon]